MTIHMVAQREAPSIFCPPWCERSGDHVEELSDWEGRALHTGYWPTATARGPVVQLGRTLLPNGEPDDADDFAVMLEGHTYTLEEAEKFAAILADVIKAARAEQARTA